MSVTHTTTLICAVFYEEETSVEFTINQQVKEEYSASLIDMDWCYRHPLILLDGILQTHPKIYNSVYLHVQYMYFVHFLGV